ncbi:hypothetical protein EST38_g7931 [Candolleomyces aberdarensis]|uniref:Uncharacterized protein n=1 Tax=Candolleomyces aberdarensis TaxID=2316362 RepID=A0A4Q2DDY8_9AGAR|nr:hypothetical protein EST38_g7931 [Candolleomyces aberdarensis]
MNASSRVTDRSGESQFYFKDVFLEYIARVTDGDHTSLNLAELVIFGLPDEPHGKCIPLVTASPK